MLDPSAKASCAGHGGLSARQSLLPECPCRIPVRDTIHLYPRRSGNLRLRRACWLAEPGRPGGKQWGFGAANPPESIPAHRPALPAAISHRTLAASSSTQSQCTRERSKLKLSVPATQQPAFFRSRIRIAWRVAAVNVPFSMPCSRIVRQPYINERKRVDPRSPSASIASVSIGEQPFSELSERIT